MLGEQSIAPVMELIFKVQEDRHRLALPQGQALLLIKPQFELGPKALNKNGIVKDKAQYAMLRQQAVAAAEKRELVVKGWFESPVTGGDGNTEFFIWVQKP